MKGFMAEFKEFINKGNVMDMAVGMIIGAAFTSVISSLVNDIFTPLIAAILGVPEWEMNDILWPAVRDAAREIYDHGC